MPTQKLTKARLVQILFMLSVLVGAFLWRTFTHEMVNKINCSQKERCDLTIKGEIITINRNSIGISVETAENSTLKIDLNRSGEFTDSSSINKIIKWSAISKTKIITLKVDEMRVAVQL